MFIVCFSLGIPPKRKVNTSHLYVEYAVKCSQQRKHWKPIHLPINICQKMAGCYTVGKNLIFVALVLHHLHKWIDLELHMFNMEHHDSSHMRVLMNTVEETNLCSQCYKTFPRRGALQDHISYFTREKPYTCWRCDESVTRKRKLYGPMEVHPGGKPYQCDLCLKSFTQKGNLRSHMLLHTADKPHECNQCDKLFTQKTALKHHMTVHTGEKAYKCSQCDKAFTQKGSLKRHLNVHASNGKKLCL